MHFLNESIALPYAQALVAGLKQEGTLSQPLVEAAFLRVPRHVFLERFFRRQQRDGRTYMQEFCPASYPDSAGWLRAVYADEPLTIAYDEEGTATSSSSSPGAMTIMLEACELAPGQRVLEVGTGTGYNAALLASLVESPRLVVTVEIDADLAAQAERRIAQVVGPGVTVHVGNGLQGYAPGAPYERVLMAGSTSSVPLPLLAQVRPGGIILMNLIGAMGACAFLKVVKEKNGLAARGHFLSASEFMEFHEAGRYPRRRAPLVGQYIARPLTTQACGLRGEFDLSLLWDRRLHFALQLAFPGMSFASVYVDPMCPCLLDQGSDTMLLFRPTGEEDFQIEVRGDPCLWERVRAVYQQWIGLGRPGVRAYQLSIDTQGRQKVILAPGLSRQGTSAWPLDQRA
jgi:protein-L-isoaspartate(D-aspartate) O-methyltransferase